MKPLTLEINRCQYEIADARWLDVSEDICFSHRKFVFFVFLFKYIGCNYYFYILKFTEQGIGTHLEMDPFRPENK